MLLKRAFLLLVLSGIVINADAMKRRAEGFPEGEPNAKFQCIAPQSAFQEVLPQENSQIILTYCHNLMAGNTSPEAVLEIIRAARLSFRLSVPATVELVRTLLAEHNLSLLNAIDGYDGRTALHLACRAEDIDSVRILCCVPQNYDELWQLLAANDITGVTALHHAVAYNEIVKILLRAAGDNAYLLMSMKCHADHGGYTAFSLAVYMAPIHVVKTMLKVAGDQAYDLMALRDDGNAHWNSPGNTALMSRYYYPAMIMLLLQSIGDRAKALALILMANQKGETVLHRNAKHGSYRSIKKVLDFVGNNDMQRALILMRTNEGKDVLDCAKDYAPMDNIQLDTVTILESYFKKDEPADVTLLESYLQEPNNDFDDESDDQANYCTIS